MVRVQQQEKVSLLGNTAVYFGSLQIENLLFQGETLKYISNEQSWKDRLLSNLVVLFIFICLSGVCVVEPLALGAWKLAMALSSMPIASAWLAYYMLTCKTFYMVTNYRVAIVTVRNSVSLRYLFFGSVTDVELKDNTITFTSNPPTLFQFSKLNDIEHVYNIINEIRESSPPPITHPPMQITSPHSTSMLTESYSNLLSQHLSASPTDSVLWLHIPTFYEIWKVILLTTVVTNFFFLWMVLWVCIYAGGAYWMLSIAPASTILTIFYLLYLLGKFNQAAALTNNNILLFATGLNMMSSSTQCSVIGSKAWNNLTIIPLTKDIGVINSTRVLNSSVGKGTIRLQGLVWKTIEGPDIHLIEEYIFCAVCAHQTPTEG